MAPHVALSRVMPIVLVKSPVHLVREKLLSSGPACSARAAPPAARASDSSSAGMFACLVGIGGYNPLERSGASPAGASG